MPSPLLSLVAPTDQLSRRSIQFSFLEIKRLQFSTLSSGHSLNGMYVVERNHRPGGLGISTLENPVKPFATSLDFYLSMLSLAARFILDTKDVFTEFAS